VKGKEKRIVRIRNRLSITFLIVIILASFFIATRIVYSQDYADSDFFSFWLAGRMSFTSQYLYQPDQWIEGHHQFGAEWISDPTFLYPLPLAVLFYPLGSLNLGQAYVTWVLLSMIMILVSLYLLMSPGWSESSKHYVFPILAGVFLFRPTIITLKNGQLGAAFLFILAIIIYLWEKGRWLEGGVALAFLSLKPSLGLSITAMLVLWLLLARKWRAILGFIGSSAGLLLIGWLVDSSWLRDYIQIGSQKVVQNFGYTPTLWGASALVCHQGLKCRTILGGIVAVLIIIISVYLFSSNGIDLAPSSMVSLIIPITLLLTPYLWAYDQVLLTIPIVLVMMKMSDKGYPYLLSSTIFLFFSLVAAGLVFIALQVKIDGWSMLVPFLTWILVLGVLFSKTRVANSLTPR